MFMNKKLKKLPKEVVNQIAAGEVIQRPASVVKELVDNSIDAGASKIIIKVNEGGISLIEVSDDGFGIPKDDLSEVFQAHTTSKLSDISDLNNLLSMGFRGEALSTIVAVSRVTMISKNEDEDIANEIIFEDQSNFKIKKAAREGGTIVRVENIFDNIPARKKFLKTAQTEYRKIFDILTPYFLIYPNISWELYKDGKKVTDLISQTQKSGEIVKERVKDVLRGDFVERMEKVFFDGNGIKITGLIAHPSDHVKTTKYQYIFVNNRNVWDNGIARAVIQAYDRYIPHGHKIPFLLNIDIKPDQIDINVHPRKEEINFLNPYRAYSSVESAVERSLKAVVSYKNIPDKQYSKTSENSNKLYKKEQRDISFSKGATVKDSLDFSKAILEGVSDSKDTHQSKIFDKVTDEDNIEDVISFYQIFNKYIIVQFTKSIWIIDQHAAAERITFEKLVNSLKSKNVEIQKLLVPTELKLDGGSIEFFKENLKFFEDIGFKISILHSKVFIDTVPVQFVNSDIEKIFMDVLDLDIDNIKGDFDKFKSDIIATMACHTSIRSGQKLDISIMKELYYNLLDCENPYSCPHGRPIVWKMSIEDIDSKFDRTY